MAQLIEEVKQWNTPLVGAYMLWRFTIGYVNNHKSGDSPIGLLHFIANSILTSKKLLEHVNDHRDNLQSYVKGFEDSKSIDLLMDIQDRVKKKQKYTLQSIDIAISEGLLFWDYDTGKLFPRKDVKKPNRGKTPKAVIMREGNKAEILGKWFAELELTTIATYLKIVL